MDDPFQIPPEAFGQIPLFAELAKVLSWQGGPVNWELARQFAVAVAGTTAPQPSQADVEETRENLRLAELWLAEATGMPEPPRLAQPSAVTPAGLAERAAAGYRELIDPLAQRIAQAVGEQQLPQVDAGAQGLFGPEVLAQAMRQMAPMFLGIQTGVVLGALASDALTQYDVPLPVGDDGSAVIVLPAVDAFAEAYGIDRREARLWAALHESAHRIEMEALPTARATFFALYHNYVSSLSFDLAGLADRLQSIDPTDPQRLQDALNEGLVGFLDSPASSAALDRVQSFVALLEAVADRAVEAAGQGRFPSVARISEAAARRRAEESRGARLFQQFIGLDLRPERLRAADRFTRAVLDDAGWAGLNRMWEAPDGVPSVDEMSDPAAWIARVLRAQG